MTIRAMLYFVVRWEGEKFGTLFYVDIDLPFVPPKGLSIFLRTSMKGTDFEDSDPLDLTVDEVTNYDLQTKSLSINCEDVYFGRSEKTLDVAWLLAQGAKEAV